MYRHICTNWGGDCYCGFDLGPVPEIALSKPANLAISVIWEGVVRVFLIAMANAVMLSGCASHSSAYTRTDGVPVDPLHQQATLAQCKGEGATAVVQNPRRNVRGA
jgi:hypothetical protein